MASRFRQKDPPLKSWDCKGCTNICYRLLNGETMTYCKPMLEGRARHEWVTEDYLACLDYTTDSTALDMEVTMWGIR